MITHAIEMRALELANNLRFSPEGRRRVSHTETMWKYRSYIGGEPASSIDWKQSARSREIIVREHEKITHRDIYLMSLLSPDAPVVDLATTVMLALAYTLVRKERAVGWLGAEKSLTRTTSLVSPLIEKGLAMPNNNDYVHNLHKAFIIMTVDIGADDARHLKLLRAYAAQGNLGLLLHTGVSDVDPSNPVIKAAHNAAWPLLRLKADERPDIILTHLLEKTLDGTR